MPAGDLGGAVHAGEAADELRDAVADRIPYVDLAKHQKRQRDRRIHMGSGTLAPGRIDECDRRQPHRSPDQDPTKVGIRDQSIHRRSARLEQDREQARALIINMPSARPSIRNSGQCQVSALRTVSRAIGPSAAGLEAGV